MKYNSNPDIYYGDKEKRFSLGLSGKNSFIVLGINPSTADDRIPDKTILRVIRFSEHYGCDGWIMINIYPQRSTDPSNLPEECDLELHHKNIEHITKILAEYPNHIMCAAWGTPIRERKYLLNCLKDIYRTIGGKWVSIGKVTKEGHPKHPARLANNLELEKFDIEEYLR